MKKTIFAFCFFMITAQLMFFAACSKEESGVLEDGVQIMHDTQVMHNNKARLLNTDALFALSDKERNGGFESGMGFTESSLREEDGDYAGSVLAVFKEFYFAYSFAKNETESALLKEGIIKGLTTMRVNLELNAQLTEAAKIEINAAVNAALNFIDDNYKEAYFILQELSRNSKTKEPDSFLSWLTLVSAMETEKNEAAISELRASYGAIQKRYEYIPAYWYFASRSAKGDDIPRCAERAINLAPEGVFAPECRRIIASFVGLSEKDGGAIMTRYEIENKITRAVNKNEPRDLEELFPLIALSDNPYTIYAMGAMRSLSESPAFKHYFTEKCAVAKKDKSAPRLAERLTYISRG